jgi:uncharacterized RDD family membrane protein YckC
MTQPTGWPQPPAGPQGGWAPQMQAGPAPGVTFGGFWIRFVAYLIDVLLFGVVFVALSAVSTTLAYIAYLAVLVYFPVCWVQFGQTIGMMPFGLRVVRDADGGKLTWSNGIMRLIGWVVSGVVLDIGFIWAAFDARKRGWHDMIGGTVVIRQ